MAWTNDIVLEFLELYEGEPAVWNPKDSQHKNRNLVHDGWKRIEEKLSIKMTVDELKKKKDALMATFRKISQKVKAASGTGTGTEDVDKPDWFAYDYMRKFLHAVYQPNKTTNSEELQEEIADNTEKAEENEGDKANEDDGKEETVAGENVEDLEMPSTSTKKPENQVSRKGRKRKVQPITNFEKRMEEAYQVFNNLSESETKNSDECSLYTELLATKLRALDENSRGIAMLEIDHLMYRLKNSKNLALQTPPFVQTYTNPSPAQYFQHNMQNRFHQSPEYSFTPYARFQQSATLSSGSQPSTPRYSHSALSPSTLPEDSSATPSPQTGQHITDLDYFMNQ